MSMGDFKFGIEFMDTMEKHIVAVLNKVRPPEKFATVVSWDIDNLSAMITYNEPDAEPVKVAMTCIFPSYAGQTCIVDGPRTARRIVAVIGHMRVEGGSP